MNMHYLNRLVDAIEAAIEAAIGETLIACVAGAALIIVLIAEFK